MRLGSFSSHIRVVAAAPNASFLSGDLRLSGILMLSDDVAAKIKQGDGGALFLIQVKPSVGYFYIDFGVFIHALNTEGKCVDTTGDLGVAASLCGNIADLVAFGFQAGCNAGE